MIGEWSQYFRQTELNDLEVLHARFIEHRFARHSHDYYVIGFVEAGVQAFAFRGARHVTPAGQVFVVNPGEPHTGEASARYKRTIEGTEGLRSPKDIGNLTKDDIASYDGIYIAGGHGCMEDMRASPPMTRFLLAVLALDKPLASVCHGPSAFLSPRDMAGESPFAGYRMTCFSHNEEFATKINVITGQNPFSSEAVANHFLDHLAKC